MSLKGWTQWSLRSFSILVSLWLHINSAHRTSMFQIWQQGSLILHSKINVLKCTQIVNTSRKWLQMKSHDWKKLGKLILYCLSFSKCLIDFLKLLLIYASMHMFSSFSRLFSFAVNPHPDLWFSIWETIWNNHDSILNCLLPLLVIYFAQWQVWPA